MHATAIRPARAGAIGAVAAIAYLCLSYGLLTYWPELQTGLLVGAVAGLLGERLLESVIPTVVGTLVMSLVYPPWYFDPAAGASPRAGSALLVSAGAAAACAAVVWTLSRVAPKGRRRALIAAAALVVAILVVNLWATTLQVDSVRFGTASVFERLQQQPVPGSYSGDDQLYLRIFYLTHTGTGYYDAVRQAWQESADYGGGLPFGTFSYRLPTAFLMWRLLAADGSQLVLGLLAFATMGIVASAFVGGQLGQPGLGVLGACAVAAHYLFATTSMYATFVDPWATAIALVAIALYVRAIRTGSSGWMWSAALVALLAALFREHLIYLSFAALIASLLANPRGARLRGALPWVVALAATAIALAGHVVAIGGQVDTTSTVAKWFQGSPAHLAATLSFARAFLNAREWFQLALVAMGIAGSVAVFVLGWRQLGLFLGLAILGPLVAFVFFGNGTIDATTGRPDGYWGLLVLPVAFASMPLALGWIPGILKRSN